MMLSVSILSSCGLRSSDDKKISSTKGYNFACESDSRDAYKNDEPPIKEDDGTIPTKT